MRTKQERRTKIKKIEELREQLKVMEQEDDLAMIVREGLVDDVLLDDSLANILRLMLFGQGAEEEEELWVLLNFTREKLHRLMTENERLGLRP